MTEKRKIIYGLLLCGAFLLLSVLVAPGNAYARYITSAGWNTVINAPSGTLPVLTKDNTTLTVPVPEMTGEVVFAIQKMQTDGTYAEYTGEGLIIQQEEESVQIHLDKPFPPAGTYQMVITWTSEDAATASVETVTFFINYSEG